MTLKQLIAKKRAALAAQVAERDRHKSTIDTIRGTLDREGREPTEDEARQVTEARAACRKIDADLAGPLAEIEQLEAELREDEAADVASREIRAGASLPDYDDVARVGNEERTYTAEKSARGEASFFADAWGAQRGNSIARQRLDRQLAEALHHGEISQRAVTTASFAGLVVPQYLIGMAARVLRSGRPVANACTELPLPEQGMSLIIPRGTTAAAVSSQATENTSLQNTDEVWANLTVPVCTIGGQQDISRQMLERGSPGTDELVYLDLASAYHAELDRQVITGSGASGQMLGIFNTAGIFAATAYGAPITFQNFNSKVAGQVAAVAGVGVGINPKLIFMSPRRWGWMTSLVDSAGRPLISPQAQVPFNAGGINMNPGLYGGDGGDDVDTRETLIVGSMQGLPITTDANVPTTVGTNSEDLVGVMDPNQAILWEEGDGMPKQLDFEQTLGGQLTVKLVVYGYAAFTAGRYPTAFGKTGGLDAVGGNGQIAPTF